MGTKGPIRGLKRYEDDGTGEPSMDGIENSHRSRKKNIMANRNLELDDISPYATSAPLADRLHALRNPIHISKYQPGFFCDRVMSTKMIRSKEQENELAVLRKQLSELHAENKLLQALQHRQAHALKKFEDTKGQLPQLIQSHAEEVRALKAKCKKVSVQNRDLEKKLRNREVELHAVQEQIRHWQQLAKDKSLGEREMLRSEVDDLKNILQQMEMQFQEFARRKAIELRMFQQKLQQETSQNKELKKSLLCAEKTINELKAPVQDNGKTLGIEKSVNPSKLFKEEKKQGTSSHRLSLVGQQNQHEPVEIFKESSLTHVKKMPSEKVRDCSSLTTLNRKSALPPKVPTEPPKVPTEQNQHEAGEIFKESSLTNVKKMPSEKVRDCSSLTTLNWKPPLPPQVPTEQNQHESAFSSPYCQHNQHEVVDVFKESGLINEKKMPSERFKDCSSLTTLSRKSTLAPQVPTEQNQQDSASRSPYRQQNQHKAVETFKESSLTNVKQMPSEKVRDCSSLTTLNRKSSLPPKVPTVDEPRKFLSQFNKGLHNERGSENAVERPSCINVKINTRESSSVSDNFYLSLGAMTPTSDDSLRSQRTGGFTLKNPIEIRKSEADGNFKGASLKRDQAIKNPVGTTKSESVDNLKEASPKKYQPFQMIADNGMGGFSVNEGSRFPSPCLSKNQNDRKSLKNDNTDAGLSAGSASVTLGDDDKSKQNYSGMQDQESIDRSKKEKLLKALQAIDQEEWTDVETSDDLNSEGEFSVVSTRAKSGGQNPRDSGSKYGRSCFSGPSSAKSNKALGTGNLTKPDAMHEIFGAIPKSEMVQTRRRISDPSNFRDSKS